MIKLAEAFDAGEREAFKSSTLEQVTYSHIRCLVCKEKPTSKKVMDNLVSIVRQIQAINGI